MPQTNHAAMPDVPAAAGAPHQPPTDLKAAMSELAGALFQTTTSTLSRQIDKLEGRLRDVAEGGGATAGAAVAAGVATIEGKNPVWAAVKGAWFGASTPVKILMVVTLILAVLLLPVELLMLLLGLGYLGVRAAVK